MTAAVNRLPSLMTEIQLNVSLVAKWSLITDHSVVVTTLKKFELQFAAKFYQRSTEVTEMFVEFT